MEKLSKPDVYCNFNKGGGNKMKRERENIPTFKKQIFGQNVRMKYKY